jgi:hypothetical protein
MLCGVAGQPVGAADDRHKWWLSEPGQNWVVGPAVSDLVGLQSVLPG